MYCTDSLVANSECVRKLHLCVNFMQICARRSRLDCNINIFSNRLDAKGDLEYWELIEMTLLKTDSE